MLRFLFASFFIAIASLSPAPYAAEGTAPPKGFVALFNGKDLTGWHGMPHFDPYKLAAMTEADRKAQIAKWTDDAKKHWTRRERRTGQRRQRGLPDHRQGLRRHRAAASSTRPWPRPTAASTSGPRRRCKSGTHQGGRQVGPRRRQGQRRAVQQQPRRRPASDPLVLADKPFGEWNQFRILMVGERVTVYLNDKLVVDHARLENFWNRRSCRCRRTGPIQLQTHGGEIRWRNVFVREIPSAEANAILRKHGAAGLRGRLQRQGLHRLGRPDRQLRGQGRGHRLQAEEGRQHLHQGGVRRLRRPRRVPAAAGRQQRPGHPLPRQGRSRLPSPCARCRSWTTPPRSTRSSTRASTTARPTAWSPPQRGYLRPVGEWNFMEVTAVGSTIRVELNGTRILDADLSKVTEFMGDQPAPRQGPHERATSASPATTTRSRSASSRSADSTKGGSEMQNAECRMRELE